VRGFFCIGLYNAIRIRSESAGVEIMEKKKLIGVLVFIALTILVGSAFVSSGKSTENKTDTLYLEVTHRPGGVPLGLSRINITTEGYKDIHFAYDMSLHSGFFGASWVTQDGIDVGRFFFENDGAVGEFSTKVKSNYLHVYFDNYVYETSDRFTLIIYATK
jgi:hypothetical protein